MRYKHIQSFTFLAVCVTLTISVVLKSYAGDSSNDKNFIIFSKILGKIWDDDTGNNLVTDTERLTTSVGDNFSTSGTEFEFVVLSTFVTNNNLANKIRVTAHIEPLFSFYR